MRHIVTTFAILLGGIRCFETLHDDVRRDCVITEEKSVSFVDELDPGGKGGVRAFRGRRLDHGASRVGAGELFVSMHQAYMLAFSASGGWGILPYLAQKKKLPDTEQPKISLGPEQLSWEDLGLSGWPLLPRSSWLDHSCS